MNDTSTKASICAIVHLEVIDFSKKIDAEQAEIKNQLNHLINHAVIDIAHNNRAILNVADGTVIACIGPLEDALEDALLISLTIRDEILENNSLSSNPLYVRFGINLGAAQVSSDVNVKPSIVGESIDEAQRIMSFAKPNQILVSRPYYEMASKLSQEISQMFEYHDMHANEQDIYSVRLLKDLATIEESSSIPTDNSQPAKWQSIISKINWNYVPPNLLILGLLVFLALFVLVKLVSTPTVPTVPTITLVQPALKVPPANAVTNLPSKSNDNFLLPNESLEKPSPQVSLGETKPVQKKANKKIAQKKAIPKPVAEIKTKTSINTAEKPLVSKVEKGAEKDKTGWEAFKDSVKQGADRPCSQAEIAMNQCR